MMSDEEILSLYRSGDRERAFGELVKSLSERLYWHVRGLVGNHEDTDDLLQDIFVKVWNALPGFRGDSQLYTWIFRIATNESLNFLRKQSLRATLGLEKAERVINQYVSDGWTLQEIATPDDGAGAMVGVFYKERKL